MNLKQVIDPTRLGALLLPLTLSCCAKDLEEVQTDVRAVVREIHDREDMGCEAAEILAGAILDGRGYQQEGNEFSARGATVSIFVREDYLSVTASDQEGSLITQREAPCKPESLQR